MKKKKKKVQKKQRKTRNVFNVECCIINIIIILLSLYDRRPRGIRRWVTYRPWKRANAVRGDRPDSSAVGRQAGQSVMLVAVARVIAARGAESTGGGVSDWPAERGRTRSFGGKGTGDGGGGGGGPTDRLAATERRPAAYRSRVLIVKHRRLASTRIFIVRRLRRHKPADIER